MADDAGALIAIRWPVLEAVVRQLVGFDAKSVHDDSGAAAVVAAVDCLLQKISQFAFPPMPTARNAAPGG